MKPIAIGPSDTIQSTCRECGGDLFNLVYRHRILPAIHPKNPTRQDQPVKIEVFLCTSCGKELNENPEAHA